MVYPKLPRNHISSAVPGAEDAQYCTPVDPTGILTAENGFSIEWCREQCGRCKTVAYCNRECQKLHWTTHKGACHA